MRNSVLTVLCNEWFTETGRNNWDNATIEEIHEALEALKKIKPGISAYSAEEIWSEMQDIIAEYDQANKPE